MSMAETMTREDKENWLLRPLNWALRITVSMAVFVVTVWSGGELSKLGATFLLSVSVATLFVVGVLLLWGVRRINFVTGGRV